MNHFTNFVVSLMIVVVFFIYISNCSDKGKISDPKELAKITIVNATEDEKKLKEVFKEYGYDLDDGLLIYNQSLNQIKQDPYQWKKYLEELKKLDSIDNYKEKN